MISMDFTENFEKCLSTDREVDDFINLERVDKLCVDYNLRWKLLNDIIFIYSSVGTWHFCIYPEPNINLFHKNSRCCKEKEYICSNFHKQNIVLADVYETLLYINNHDKRLLIRDNIRFKNSSINKTFKKIKKAKHY